MGFNKKNTEAKNINILISLQRKLVIVVSGKNTHFYKCILFVKLNNLVYYKSKPFNSCLYTTSGFAPSL